MGTKDTYTPGTPEYFEALPGRVMKTISRRKKKRHAGLALGILLIAVGMWMIPVEENPEYSGITDADIIQYLEEEGVDDEIWYALATEL